METTLNANSMVAQPDQPISDVIQRERTRLRNFIRARVPDPLDAEDILQEVFYELVLADRLMQPLEQVGAWLFRVARNRITDRFRKKKPDASLDAPSTASDDGELLYLEEILPSPDADPDALYARSLLLQELEDAVDELPREQREVFIAHEIEGRSFKSLAAETGVSLNTLLSRKHYAVLHLRQRLHSVYEEFAKR